MIRLHSIHSTFNEKFEETLSAVLPILLIVLLLCFSIAPIPPSILMTFLTGANVGFMPAGNYLGQTIAGLSYPWIIVPMTAIFLLPFAMGACEAVGGTIITDAFGIVAMVAMTPLITIQIMGLASSEILDYLGLESNQKAVSFSVMEDSSWLKVKRQMEKKLKIDAPGGGISFTIPLSSIGGMKTLQFLLEKQDYQKEEESTLKNTDHQLIIVIT